MQDVVEILLDAISTCVQTSFAYIVEDDMMSGVFLGKALRRILRAVLWNWFPSSDTLSVF